MAILDAFPVVFLFLLSLVAAVVIYMQLESLTNQLVPSLSVAIAGGMLILAYFFFFSKNVLVFFQQRFSNAKLSTYLSIGMLASYFIYFFGTQSETYSHLILFTACFALPLWLSGKLNRFQLAGDLAVLIVCWTLFDERALMPLWTWPKGELGYTFHALLISVVVACYFYIGRGLSTAQYFFKCSYADLKGFLFCFLMMLLICVPIGIGLDFIAWQGFAKYDQFPLRFLAIFLTIAIPEELVFRGVLQNLLSKYIRTWLAILLAALLFGATHYNNGLNFDWRYILLATIAGCFYGYLFSRSRSVFVCALLHATVDTVWLLFLWKPH